MDTLEIQVELPEDSFSDEVKDLEALRSQIYKGMESTLGLAAKITLVNPKSIQRSEGKAKRVIDKRNLAE